jgi:hypothetical protein
MFGPVALDEIEKRCWRDLWHTAVWDAVEEYRIDLVEFGPVQASIVLEEPGEPSLNLVLGAAASGSVQSGNLQRAVGWARRHGVDYRVPVTPGGPEAKLAERWLIESGHEQGDVHAKLVRGVLAPDLPPPRGIEVVVRHQPDDDECFSVPFARSLGMPCWASTFFFDLPGRKGWHCYAAIEGDDAFAYAAMIVHRGLAELILVPPVEWAERVPEGQVALLRRCIEDAAAAGCEAIVAAVDEPRHGARPTTSRESLLLAGFEQAFVRADWRPPRHAVTERDLTRAWI